MSKFLPKLIKNSQRLLKIHVNDINVCNFSNIQVCYDKFAAIKISYDQKDYAGDTQPFVSYRTRLIFADYIDDNTFTRLEPRQFPKITQLIMPNTTQTKNIPEIVNKFNGKLTIKLMKPIDYINYQKKFTIT